MEIERKFLVDLDKFDYKEYPHKDYTQGYLCTNPVVRARKEGDEYVLTYKGKGKMVREEYNLPLNEEAFNHLIAKADGRIIEKTRYFIPFGKYTIELDEFKGELAPLVMAEVEFPNIDECEAFVKPEWFLDDVTQDPRYHNSTMSKR